MLTAVLYDRPMKNGRTTPLLLVGLDAVNAQIEVVAKFTVAGHLEVNGLIREAFAAFLAVEVGVPMPRAHIIRIDQPFIASVTAASPSVGARLSAACPVGFATTKLAPGYSTWHAGRVVPVGAMGEAAKILAFDCLIYNADRMPNNPNLLCDGTSLAAFDHELAFMPPLFTPAPWQTGGLTGSVNGHVLAPHLRNTVPDLSAFQAAWSGVSDTKLSNFQSSLPPEWASGVAVAQDVMEKIRDVRDNLPAAIAELHRALA